jgi:integrase
VRSLTDDRLFPPTAAAKKAAYLDLRQPFAAALESAALGHYEGEEKERRFIPNFHWHDLRHTCASYLAMAGTSPLEIAKVLGHRTMAMVARYSHLSPGRVVELGDMLAERMGVGK